MRSPYCDAVDFGVLGPLRVEGASGRVEIRGAKERLLLARLIAAHGHVVPAGALIDTLWGDSPPRSAAKSLQTFVARLRGACGPHLRHGRPLIVTEGSGYRLAFDPSQVDAERFARLADLGRTALEQGQPASAHRTLQSGLALWRGAAYADVDTADFAVVEATRLEERRLTATEDLLSALVELGRQDEAVPELEALVRSHPLREHAWELLVTALYRSGRQGDALAAYERARVILAERLGVDPGPSLRAVHARVLAQDPSLSAASAAPQVPSRLRPPPDPPGLVGRDVELQRLRDAWHRATAGPPGVVALRGPHGAGASALAATLAHELAREGVRTAYLSAECPTGPRAGDEGRPSLLVADHTDPPSGHGATLTLLLLSSVGVPPGQSEVIDLEPLGRAAVRRIVAAYLPPEDVDEVIDRVLVTPAWPGAVHEIARDHAHDRTVHRVRVAASLALTSSGDLSAARAELADGVTALRSEADRDAPHSDTCPWRGLEAYDVDDARWYAGRDRLVAEILARLAASRLVALVGASGSGKSSALRAGVLAALQEDVLPGSAGWRTVVVRPGAHPVAELARHALGPHDEDLVARLRDGGEHDRTVVAVDQFEEVWTVCADPDERTRFLDLLAELATDPSSAVTVVIAVRADYADALAEHEAMRALVGDGAVLVGPMAPAEVRRVVERPARSAGLALDDGLAESIVSDAGTEPGLLPLLSTALAELWERRDGRRLGYPAYVALGGLDGAIATLAERAYGELSPDEQRTARTLLLRLTGPGDGDAVTRRRVLLGEIEALPDPAVRDVLERLVTARLLTRSEGTVEVAHEALFREWPRLRGWLAEDAAGRAVQRRLALAATEWDAEGREAPMLWGGARLDAALDVARQRPEELTAVEHEFVDAGRRAVDAERLAAEERAAAAARSNRRLRLLVAGVSVLLLTALAAGTLAWTAQREAAAANTVADARRLAATALNIEQPDLALLAAVEATRRLPDVDTYGALLSVLSQQPAVVHRVRTSDVFLRLRASRDGSTVFLSEGVGRVRAIDGETGEQLWIAATPGGRMVHEMAVSEDGGQVVVALWPSDTPPHGGVVSFDARDGSVRWATLSDDILAAAPDSDPAPRGVGVVGDEVVTETGTHMVVLDAATGEVRRSWRVWPERIPPLGTSLVWPDGRTSVNLGLGYLRSAVHDPDRPDAPPLELEGVVYAVSPDGRRVLVASEDEQVDPFLHVADAATGEPLTDRVPMDGFPTTALWDPDGERIYVGMENVLRVFDPDTLEEQAAFVGHSATIMGLGLAGTDRSLIWTASRDGSAVAFDLTGTRTAIVRRPSEPVAYLGRSAPAAGRAVHLHHSGGTGEHRAWLSELPSGRTLGRLVPDLSGTEGADDAEIMTQPSTVAIDAEGGWALVGMEQVHRTTGTVADRGFLAVFDPATRKQQALVELPWPVRGVAVGRDRALVHGTGGYAVVDLASASLVRPPTGLPEAPFVEMLSDAEVSPGGDLVAFGRGAEVLVVELASGEVTSRIWADHEGGAVGAESAGAGVDGAAGDEASVYYPAVVLALDWTPDGATLVTGTDRGWLGFWSAQTGEPVAPPSLLNGSWILDVEVSLDGRMLVASNREGATTLVDAETWRPYGLPITEEARWIWPVFSADSRDLTVFVEDGEAVEFSMVPDEWAAAACSAAGRDLTDAELETLLPGAEGRTPTCPQ
jgi:DNA-binding SARP family transcriptional activator/WD40 repeat protein